ncbi:hypothetical protein [Sphaerisporangium fuscum]|uniref:hypothetical protein n=1 Tax=Sphaerisporangium fuscum TaxID=2835868 RepID=UPI001BDC7F88|nr:hypothetical protein [Sphaerisporangium fuscum]
MKLRVLLAVSGWLGVVLAATGAGVVVTGFLGEAMTGSATRALSAADVRRALDTSPSTTPDASSSATPDASSSTGPGDSSALPDASPSPSSPAPSPRASSASSSGGTSGQARSKALAARGGVVVARCDGGLVTLQSWTPAQGYEVKDAERGPREKVRVRFETESSRTELEIRCSDGHPVSTVKYD